jgi:hypothetical protein
MSGSGTAYLAGFFFAIRRTADSPGDKLSGVHENASQSIISTEGVFVPDGFLK